MEKIEYVSSVVTALAEEIPLVLNALCASCTASIWYAPIQGKSARAECFCTKMHREIWKSDGGSKPIAMCDGFTNKPPVEE